MKIGVFFFIFSTILLSNSIHGQEKEKRILIVSETQKKLDTFVDKLISYSVKDKVKYEYVVINKYTELNEYQENLSGKYDMAVLVDNTAIKLHQKYNQKNKPIKALCVLALSVENEIAKDKNLVGIRFEPPVFTLVSSFNYIFSNNVKKIAVVYREKEFQSQIVRAKKELELLGVELVEFPIQDNKDLNEEYLNIRLKEVRKEKDVDALWVPLDSIILSKNLFQAAWVPFSKEYSKPIISQLETLTYSNLNFATYSISSDILDLASQANQLVNSILSGTTSIEEVRIEESISIKKYVNKKKAQSLNLIIEDDKAKEVIFSR